MNGLTREEYEAVLDHGTWNYGLLPGNTDPVTACLTHRGEIVPSYIREHAHYEKTIFSRPFETMWGTWDPDEPEPVIIPETHYADDYGNEYHFPEAEMKYIGHGLHAVYKWQEHSFCQKLKRGDISVPAPTIIKGYVDDVIIHEDYVGELRETFIEYVRTLREEGRDRPTPTQRRMADGGRDGD